MRPAYISAILPLLDLDPPDHLTRMGISGESCLATSMLAAVIFSITFIARSSSDIKRQRGRLFLFSLSEWMKK